MRMGLTIGPSPMPLKGKSPTSGQVVTLDRSWARQKLGQLGDPHGRSVQHGHNTAPWPIKLVCANPFGLEDQSISQPE